MSAEVKALRAFGCLVGAVFAIIGAWPVLRYSSGPRFWALAAAAVFLGPALFYPRALAPVHLAWMRVGHVLGWINTRLILALVFYLVFLPVGMMLRLMGKDPMRRGFDRQTASYRVIRQERPGSHMKHQF